MRVWLLEQGPAEDVTDGETQLRALAGSPATGLVFLGRRPVEGLPPDEARSSGVEVLVVAEGVSPQGAALGPLLGLSVGVVAVTSDPAEWAAIAERTPLVF